MDPHPPEDPGEGMLPKGLGVQLGVEEGVPELRDGVGIDGVAVLVLEGDGVCDADGEPLDDPLDDGERDGVDDGEVLEDGDTVTVEVADGEGDGLHDGLSEIDGDGDEEGEDEGDGDVPQPGMTHFFPHKWTPPLRPIGAFVERTSACPRQASPGDRAIEPPFGDNHNGPSTRCSGPEYSGPKFTAHRGPDAAGYTSTPAHGSYRYPRSTGVGHDPATPAEDGDAPAANGTANKARTATNATKTAIVHVRCDIGRFTDMTGHPFWVGWVGAHWKATRASCRCDKYLERASEARSNS